MRYLAASRWHLKWQVNFKRHSKAPLVLNYFCIVHFCRCTMQQSTIQFILLAFRPGVEESKILETSVFDHWRPISEKLEEEPSFYFPLSAAASSN